MKYDFIAPLKDFWRDHKWRKYELFAVLKQFYWRFRRAFFQILFWNEYQVFSNKTNHPNINFFTWKSEPVNKSFSVDEFNSSPQILSKNSFFKLRISNAIFKKDLEKLGEYSLVKRTRFREFFKKHKKNRI